MLPQVEEVMRDYPKIQFGVVDAGDVQDIAEHFLIFTVPVLLLFVDGKEVLREARIVHIDLFREKLNRIYTAILD
ncbi:thioredoxin family protein [Neobacillus sp. SM06]|uniref:thioredoxin family protein n=1 Tax=Neobacillus sp. SM06 TaxID=3422492 RepID=UPI003D2CA1BA